MNKKAQFDLGWGKIKHINFNPPKLTPNFDISYEQTEKIERIPLKKSQKDEKFLIEQKCKCALCGVNMVEQGIIPPDFHHKDCNPANNKPENIIAVYPNCHRKETRKQWLKPKKKESSAISSIRGLI